MRGRLLATLLLTSALPGCFLDHGRDAARGVPCPTAICPAGDVCQVCGGSEYRCVAPDALMGCTGGLPFGIQLTCDGDEDCAPSEQCVAYVADLSEGMRCSDFTCDCAEGCPRACHDDGDCAGCGACVPQFGEGVPGRACVR